MYFFHVSFVQQMLLLLPVHGQKLDQSLDLERKLLDSDRVFITTSNEHYWIIFSKLKFPSSLPPPVTRATLFFKLNLSRMCGCLKTMSSTMKNDSTTEYNEIWSTNKEQNFANLCQNCLPSFDLFEVNKNLGFVFVREECNLKKGKNKRSIN